MSSAMERFKAAYVSAQIEHNGCLVDLSTSNESEMADWEYHYNGRIANIATYQDRDEIGDYSGVVKCRFSIELEEIVGQQWAWEVCHVYALDYVTTGIVPVWPAV